MIIVIIVIAIITIVVVVVSIIIIELWKLLSVSWSSFSSFKLYTALDQYSFQLFLQMFNKIICLFASEDHQLRIITYLPLQHLK